MGINALVISGSDPGAVPGGSTKSPVVGGIWGRNRIDERVKEWLCPGEVPPLSVRTSIIANDNRAPVAVAA